MRPPGPKTSKPRKRGQGGHDNTGVSMATMTTRTTRRLIREDLWAYELIVGKCYSSHCNSGGYHLDSRNLLQILYPNCVQSWARCLRSYGCTIESLAPTCFERPNNNFVNVQCFQPNQAVNHYPVDSKNLLLLSTVADMEQRRGFNGARTRRWISNDFHHGQQMSPARNIGIGSYNLGNDSTDDTEDVKPFVNSVFIKSEDDSTTFMSI